MQSDVNAEYIAIWQTILSNGKIGFRPVVVERKSPKAGYKKVIETICQEYYDKCTFSYRTYGDAQYRAKQLSDELKLPMWSPKL